MVSSLLPKASAICKTRFSQISKREKFVAQPLPSNELYFRGSPKTEFTLAITNPLSHFKIYVQQIPCF